MLPPYVAEEIENWAADFALTDAARGFGEETRAHAPAVLAAFLKAACARAGGAPAVLEPDHLQRAFLEDLPSLDVPAGVRSEVPQLVEAFLGWLQEEGRLADGRILGKAARVAGPAYLRAVEGKGTPYRHASGKIGRNDPCPCGSGRKYKKCCG